jgi:DNA-binding NtrC family response regulator
MGRPRLLLLVACPATFVGLTPSLRSSGIDVDVRAICRNSAERSGGGRPDIIVVEHLSTCVWSGLETAREIHQKNPAVPVVLATTEGSEELAVAALRIGLQDYVRLPVAAGVFVAAMERHLVDARKSSTCQEAYERDSAPARRMVVGTDAMRDIRSYAARAAKTSSTVLITGETGTGKELIAQFIHESSPRREKPFVCMNCAAIPDSLLESELFGHNKGAFTGAQEVRDGLFSAAEGGTVFLDEIGDLSPFAQAKILRVLETKEFCRLGGTRPLHVDVRFIAATNQDLKTMAIQKTFRQDLLYRLDVAHVHLPPLRERQEEIPLLVREFEMQFARQSDGRTHQFSEEVLRALLHYGWPGNVRELKNFVEQLFLMELPEQVGAEHLPAHLREFLETNADLSEREREQVISALFSTKWNKTKAAEMLKWSRMTLYRKIAKYGISDGSPSRGEAS